MTAKNVKKPAPEANAKAEPAAPVAALLAALNAVNISWCSWKSNQHLAAGVAGETDLDLLFAPNDQSAVEKIFRDNGFKILTPAWFRTFPGMMDAFVLDANGLLIHAHCHFRFVLGEKYLKSFELPWAPEILERRRPWELDASVYTSDPTDELLLLLLREALKLRITNQPPKTNDEFFWLKSRVKSRALQERTAELLSSPCAVIMAELYDTGFDLENLRELQTQVRTILLKNGWRRMTTARAVPEQFLRQCLSVSAEILTHFNILWPWFKRRRTPHSGLIIAILGADGSGKSTVTDKIFKGWNRKIDTAKIYFGRAKLPRFIKKSGAPKSPIAEIKPGYSWLFIARACFDAGRKRIYMHRAAQLRKKGVIVICDRFPQNTHMAFNDGPLLSHLLSDENNLKQKCAAWEARQFSALANAAPDIVIRLLPSLDTALARKPGENAPAHLQMKMDALKTTTFGVTAHSITINADKDLQSVLSEARAFIWSHINA